MVCEVALSFSTQQDAIIHIWDIHSGVLLASVKSPAAAIVNIDNSIIAIQHDKALIHYCSFNQKSIKAKWVLMEPLTAIKLHPSNKYCLGGGKSGRLYIWEVSSGRLIRFWDAHYSPVTSLLFSFGGELIISASIDSNIHIFNLQE
jgi:pre-rRNA-processing protein IPI3